MELITFLQGFASPALDQFMMLITNLGSEQAYVALIVLSFLTFGARAGKRMAVYFLLGVYVMELVKAFYDAPRPFHLDPSVLRTAAAGVTAEGPSFPSGHALSAILFWGLAASYVRRTAFTVAAALVTALVGVSRIYLGVHFPVDVLVGFALGAAFVLLGRLVDRVPTELGAGATIALGLIIPLGLHLLFPTSNSGLYMGGASAFLVGGALVRHRTDGPALGRALLGVIGLVLVFGALMGTSLLLPESVKYSPIGAYSRYLLVGLVGSLLAPLIGRWLRLVPRDARRAQVAVGRGLRA